MPGTFDARGSGRCFVGASHVVGTGGLDEPPGRRSCGVADLVMKHCAEAQQRTVQARQHDGHSNECKCVSGISAGRVGSVRLRRSSEDRRRVGLGGVEFGVGRSTRLGGDRFVGHMIPVEVNRFVVARRDIHPDGLRFLCLVRVMGRPITAQLERGFTALSCVIGTVMMRVWPARLCWAVVGSGGRDPFWDWLRAFQVTCPSTVAGPGPVE